ncbi:hypothetical protein Nepgr_007304 [Nepenthes gracilis]|uniref:Uncharacterized protein n=1 Tax=Nepenthes gracilis TaxID=150966 RepID=A0AAD3S6V9_NEPGR|nr:hypothetical protein Nepgr_007304 [Nepenthes gracilis]
MVESRYSGDGLKSVQEIRESEIIRASKWISIRAWRITPMRIRNNINDFRVIGKTDFQSKTIGVDLGKRTNRMSAVEPMNNVFPIANLGMNERLNLAMEIYDLLKFS